MMVLRPDLHSALQQSNDLFETILSLRGEVVREMDGRRTLRFSLNGQRFFLKAHFGIGWKEIFKNLSQLRLPVLGAKNEWQAIQRLEPLGIATTTLVGYGIKGLNPARLNSFVITEALEHTVTLEVFCRSWKADPPASPGAIRFKRALIMKVAEIGRCLHENGMNHRDFYLCHFRLNLSEGNEALFAQPPRLYLMDLHRVQMRKHTPRRWIVKDIGSLYFSSMDIGLSLRDLYRFMIRYRNKPLRAVLQEDADFWEDVRVRARKLYRSFHGHDPLSKY